MVIHKLKRPSSFIVVVLRSTMHKACVCCHEPIRSFEESVEHWTKQLQKNVGVNKGSQTSGKGRTEQAWQGKIRGKKQLS